MNPILSVIISTYNSSKTILDTINSLLNQSVSNFECIFIDGESTDGTCDIIEKNIDRIHLKGVKTIYISEKDSGIYEAWNKGLQKAKGEYVSFLNSDDWYERETIAWICDFISKNQHKNLSGIVGVRHMYSLDKIKIKEKFNSKNWKLTYLYKMPFNFPALFLKTSVYRQLNGFDESFKFSGDYDLITRAIKSNIFFDLVDKHLVNMRVGGCTYTESNLNDAALENYKIWKKNYYLLGIIFYLRKRIIISLVKLRNKITSLC